MLQLTKKQQKLLDELLKDFDGDVNSAGPSPISFAWTASRASRSRWRRRFPRRAFIHCRDGMPVDLNRAYSVYKLTLVRLGWTARTRSASGGASSRKERTEYAHETVRKTKERIAACVRCFNEEHPRQP